MFRCIVTIVMSPARVFTGHGWTNEAAEDDAANTAFETLLPPIRAQVRFCVVMFLLQPKHLLLLLS